MTTTIDIEANELDYRLFKSLKSMFKDQKIRLTIDALIISSRAKPIA